MEEEELGRINRYFLSIQGPGIQRNYDLIRFEVSTVVTMKNGAFLDVTPCGSCMKLLGGT
jgi:hypothetical protein